LKFRQGRVSRQIPDLTPTQEYSCAKNPLNNTTRSQSRKIPIYDKPDSILRWCIVSTHSIFLYLMLICWDFWYDLFMIIHWRY